MRALALLSGGLDARLAAGLVAEQGVDLDRVHFVTAFLREERSRAARRPEQPGAPVAVVDVAREHFERVVVEPRHGYGSGMNPCIDCRIYMLRKAAELAKEAGADLVVTGEVLGQTRMSQRRESLLRIAKESGLEGRVLRPLSARHLPPTIPEEDGRIDRGRLGAVHGRSRAAQAELACRLGIPEGPGGGGGGGCCLLADAGFSRRLRDLLDHAGREWPGADALERLRLGRHFRISHDVKAVVARDDEEGERLAAISCDLWTCRCEGGGAVAVAEGRAHEAGLARVAAVAARYGAGRTLPSAVVVCRRGAEERLLTVVPEADAARYLV